MLNILIACSISIPRYQLTKIKSFNALYWSTYQHIMMVKFGGISHDSRFFLLSRPSTVDLLFSAAINFHILPVLLNFMVIFFANFFLFLYANMS